MRRCLAALVVVCLSSASMSMAEESWFPPEVEDATTRQLADRVAAIGAGRTDETRLAGARELVARVRGRLEAWGDEGVSARAPEFPELEVLEGRGPLDLMARYYVCNMVLMIQLEDPDFANDEEAKMTSVAGLTAFTMAMLYLRPRFLASGGTDEGLEAFMTGPSMESILDGIQTDPPMRRLAEVRCGPPLEALLSP